MSSIPAVLLMLSGCLPYQEKPGIGTDPDGDTDIVAPDGPAVRADPAAIDAGAIDVGCPHEVSVDLESSGDEALQISELSVSGNGVAVVGVPPLPTTLQPGDVLPLTLVFEPDTNGQLATNLRVVSNDLAGDLSVPISAVATHVEQTDTFTAPDNPPVDILLAVDQSCSMDATSQSLVSNIDAFLLALNAANPDWKIGVVDVNDGCIFEQIDPGTAQPLITLASAMQEGEDMSGTETYSEQLLELMDLALAATSGGQCNAGFLRPDSSLHLVVVSDEAEQSPGSGYAASFQAVAPDVTVHGVLGQGSCAISTGGFGFVINTTGGTTTNLCTATTAEMTSLGEAIGGNLGGGDQMFALSAAAAPNTIEVRVDGAVFSEWLYEPDDHLVVVSSPLTSGETVAVTYGLLDACP